MQISESIARELGVSIDLGDRFRVMRRNQVLFATPSIDGVHGFLVGWRKSQQFREALEIIAGRRQCVDNLMSNADVAIEALSRHDR